jgi:serine protease SohB
MAFPRTLPSPPWLERILASGRRLLPTRLRGDVPLVPVVRLSGTIGFSTPLRPGLTLAGLARTLDRAFAYRHAKAVALVINSPGGSAVQSHLIHGRIRQLSQAKGVPVIAFVEDVAASGGYMIACAADEIFGDPSSIVGSIGVVGGSFGFHRLIEKIGVERRLYTSGEHKAMLDPFLPEEPGDVERLKAIQREIHDGFIALVKGRRPHLSGDEADLFSGEYWTGRRALSLGLIDGLGDVRTTLRARFGDKVLTPLVATERGWFGRRPQGVGTGGFGAFWSPPSLADDIVSALETRALWARFGL